MNRPSRAAPAPCRKASTSAFAVDRDLRERSGDMGARWGSGQAAVLTAARSRDDGQIRATGRQGVPWQDNHNRQSNRPAGDMRRDFADPFGGAVASLSGSARKAGIREQITVPVKAGSSARSAKTARGEHPSTASITGRRPVRAGQDVRGRARPAGARRPPGPRPRPLSERRSAWPGPTRASRP